MPRLVEQLSCGYKQDSSRFYVMQDRSTGHQLIRLDQPPQDQTNQNALYALITVPSIGGKAAGMIIVGASPCYVIVAIMC